MTFEDLATVHRLFTCNAMVSGVYLRVLNLKKSQSYKVQCDNNLVGLVVNSYETQRTSQKNGALYVCGLNFLHRNRNRWYNSK